MLRNSILTLTRVEPILSFFALFEKSVVIESPLPLLERHVSILKRIHHYRRHFTTNIWHKCFLLLALDKSCCKLDCCLFLWWQGNIWVSNCQDRAEVLHSRSFTEGRGVEELLVSILVFKILGMITIVSTWLWPIRHSTNISLLICYWVLEYAFRTYWCFDDILSWNCTCVLFFFKCLINR